MVIVYFFTLVNPWTISDRNLSINCLSCRVSFELFSYVYHILSQSILLFPNVLFLNPLEGGLNGNFPHNRVLLRRRMLQLVAFSESGKSGMQTVCLEFSATVILLHLSSFSF